MDSNSGFKMDLSELNAIKPMMAVIKKHIKVVNETMTDGHEIKMEAVIESYQNIVEVMTKVNDSVPCVNGKSVKYSFGYYTIGEPPRTCHGILLIEVCHRHSFQDFTFNNQEELTDQIKNTFDITLKP